MCEVCLKRLPECSAERVSDGEKIALLTLDNARLTKSNQALMRRPSARDGVAGALFVTGTLLATFGAARDTGESDLHEPDTALVGIGSAFVVAGLVALFWPKRSK